MHTQPGLGGQCLAGFIPHSVLTFFHTVKEPGGEPATASLSVSPGTELPSLLSQDGTKVLPAQNPSPTGTGTSACGV